MASRFNTLKTSIVFGFTWLDKLLPVSLRRSSLGSIYNFVEIDGLVRTSGQPTERQLQSIADSGVTTVLNLAPHKAENAIADEAKTVADLGMRYLHLPVNFKHPSEADFQQFCEYMALHQGQKLWVHCAANMRVSAFVYRYRVEILGEQEQQARADLAKIWEPFGEWRKFVSMP